MRRSRNPGKQASRFGLMRVRSPLLTQSRLISSPPGTEMFHFPGFRPDSLCVQLPVPPHDGWRVAPFGDLRIKACLPLPADFRSLPRPSSPAGAKASVVCPYMLAHKAVTKRFNSIYVAIMIPKLSKLSKNLKPLEKVARKCVKTFRSGRDASLLSLFAWRFPFSPSPWHYCRATP